MTQQHPGDDPYLSDSGTLAMPPPEIAGAGTLGASIRALREARGWGVMDVSARLKFGVRQIEALESDRWEDLPQGPSLRGLVRNYARLLDIAPDTLMQALPEHLKQHAPTTTASLAPVGAMPHGTLPRWSEGRRRRSWPAVLLTLFLIGALALAAYLVFAWWLPRNAEGVASSETLGFSLPVNRESLALEPVAPAQSVAPVATPSASGSGMAAAPAIPAPAAGAQTAAPAVGGGVSAMGQGPVAGASNPGMVGLAPGFGMPGATAAAPTAPAAVADRPADPAAPAPLVANHQLVFSATAASWVEVRDASGAVVLSSTIQPGANAQVEATPPARVVIGNAKGVSLNWQGSPVDLGPHQRGNVARLTLE